MNRTSPQPVRLEDYMPPTHCVDDVFLEVEIDDARTRVRSRLSVRRNPFYGDAGAAFVLDGRGLELVSVTLDGVPLTAEDYTLTSESLTIADTPERFLLETEVLIHPQDNTALEGLYLSRGLYCTQCEPEGFRRITFFPDRPDITAVYRTRIVADKARCPVLLSNGNLVGEGELPHGRHWAEWHDPFAKPSYLFALVAGDLACAEDRFTTRSGRDVALRLYVERGKENRCAHALAALKKAMRWDEKRFGLEYDLDCYMIVAVSDFNMGAMENKGLNIFNDKYVLARPETATDEDYAAIEEVIAHEYFHNWTGNRVTLRDWFQLSLKEGLTVFRDQEFASDTRSRPVKRIRDVRLLRAHQFPEDAGPLAHPVQPESYIEINNFYTATVYEKGAEIVRMLHTLLGEDGFRRGLDLYLRRHDGAATTVDDFLTAMAEMNDVDLDQFRLWYGQAGTPELRVTDRYEAATGRYELTVEQSCPPTPGQPEKRPFHIPFAVGLLDGTGRPIALRLEGEPPEAAAETRVLELREPRHVFHFVDVPERPVPSLLRGFSAPVRIEAPLGDEERAFLLAHDPDLFNRWEAGHQFAVEVMLRMIAAQRRNAANAPDTRFLEALDVALEDASLDPDFRAELLTLPSERYLATRMEIVDPEAIHAAREALRRAIAERLREKLLTLYHTNAVNAPYTPDPEQAGRRRLRNTALGYLVSLREPELIALCTKQFETADNMTDQVGALAILADLEIAERRAAFDAFYAQWRDDPLVVDKWLSIQATSSLPGTLETVKALLRHPAFSLANPNRVRALIGAFCSANQLRFHTTDGAGYAFLADRVIEIDRLNPQLAARLLEPLGQWRWFDSDRQAKMRAALERILAAGNVSRDVFEIASKALA